MGKLKIESLKPAGKVCGTGEGACCAGSNEGCPPEAPICSEYGYCQCASYQPGGPECGPGFDKGKLKIDNLKPAGNVCGTGPRHDNLVCQITKNICIWGYLGSLRCIWWNLYLYH